MRLRHLLLFTAVSVVHCVRPNDRYEPEDLSPPLPDLDERVACGQRREGMVLVSRGYFMMGSTADPAEQPVHEQRVLDLLLDPTEVTVGKYRACVEAGACPAPATGDPCIWGVSDREEYPVNCVTFEQAARYCSWMCKRLPTEIEWEYAARGPMGSTYPWGSEPPDTSGKAYTRICSSNQACKVAQFSSTLFGAPTMNGLYDLAGSVWEWTSSPWPCAYPLDRKDPTCKLPADAQRVLRGGYVFNLPSTSLRSAYRLHAEQAALAAHIGFRCAATP